MPAARRTQSNAMLYTLIAFVAFFLIALVVAVIYYAKFEEQRALATEAQRDLREVVSRTEWDKRGNIVGEKKAAETYLGRMVDYLDGTVSLIMGSPLEETSAEVKVDNVNLKVDEALNLLKKEHPDFESVDPNVDGLVRIIEKLRVDLNSLTSRYVALDKELKQLHSDFDNYQQKTQETKNNLLAKNEEYRQQVDKIKQEYNKLEALMKQTSDQRAQTLMDDLNTLKAEYEKTQALLLETEAKRTLAQDRIGLLQEQIRSVMPPFDSNVPAYSPDGKIILVDAQIVHLNIGTDDGVYQGLTFAVYNKGMPIPTDGKGKAEIEVFDVAKNVSMARIIHAEKRRPIVVEDVVANLIWDSDKTNSFVVAGTFDLDSDGAVDYDAGVKIEELIEKWGGKVTDAVSVDTDFLLLGRPPRVLDRPSSEQLEVDPMAMEKYEASLQELAHYNHIQTQAQALWVPVFNTERFLYFVGYKALAGRPDSF
ncbi:MAG: BRCT domain-containing protein [Planctomycetota bacterium]|jgi:hypothetical protein